MLDGHPKDVQEIILRQRLDNEVRFKDHSLSRRDTMADTTQITNDNNTLSHLSAQLNPLNITITELKKGIVNLPTINNNPSFSQPLPTFTSKSIFARPSCPPITPSQNSSPPPLPLWPPDKTQTAQHNPSTDLKGEHVKLVSSG